MLSLDPVIWVALIVLAGTLTSALISFRAPIVLFKMNAAQRHAEREEDQLERRKVREQVAEAARLQKVQNDKVETSTKVTNAALKEIHVAVNSNLDQAQREALDAKDMLVLFMEELIEFKRTHGIEPTPQVLDTMERVRQRATELRNKLHPLREI